MRYSPPVRPSGIKPKLDEIGCKKQYFSRLFHIQFFLLLFLMQIDLEPLDNFEGYRIHKQFRKKRQIVASIRNKGNLETAQEFSQYLR